MLKGVKIGKYFVPIWIIIILLVAGIGVSAYYVWQTLTIPLEVKEPLEIVSYPSKLSLYPGQTMYFDVIVRNHALVNYTLFLDFSLDNATYQVNYVTFSKEVYIAIPGENVLKAWLRVSEYAPPSNVTLIIKICRGKGYIFSGLVGYWKLDEGSGFIAFDSSGNNNHGMLRNGPVWVNGKYGKALSFDGIDDYVEIPDSPSLRIQSFTFAVWIYMTHRPYQHGSRHSAIIDKLLFQIGSGDRGYQIAFVDPTPYSDNLQVVIGDGLDERRLINYNSINDLTLYQWHFVAATWNGTLIAIYIDGELKATANTNYYTIAHDSTPLALGTEVTSGVKDVWYKGLMDEMMIFNRALSSEEIKILYKLGSP